MKLAAQAARRRAADPIFHGFGVRMIDRLAGREMHAAEVVDDKSDAANTARVLWSGGRKRRREVRLLIGDNLGRRRPVLISVGFDADRARSYRKVLQYERR